MTVKFVKNYIWFNSWLTFALGGNGNDQAVFKVYCIPYWFIFIWIFK